MKNNALQLSVSPHPFAVERVTHRIAAGSTIAQLVDTAEIRPALRRHAHVYIDGNYIDAARWARVKPKAGTTVTIRMVPMGGGGKNPLRTVLSLAMMAASPMIAAGLTASLGAGAASFMGMSAGRLITAGVNLLGRLAVNALAPPGRSRFANDHENPTDHYILHVCQEMHVKRREKLDLLDKDTLVRLARVIVVHENGFPSPDIPDGWYLPKLYLDAAKMALSNS